MSPSKLQREKAAEVVADKIIDKTLNITTFKTTLIRLLDVDGLAVFGCRLAPDSFIVNSLRKAKIPVESFTEVIMVYFSANDKIRYYDGEWKER